MATILGVEVSKKTQHLLVLVDIWPLVEIY